MGKPVERQGRKATGLKEYPMTAELQISRSLFLADVHSCFLTWPFAADSRDDSHIGLAISGDVCKRSP